MVVHCILYSIILKDLLKHFYGFKSITIKSAAFNETVKWIFKDKYLIPKQRI